MAWGIYNWGTLDLLVAKDSYNPPSSNIVMNEIRLIPSGDNLNSNTILQQGGRDRKRIKFSGYASKIDYESLVTDYLATTTRIFTDIDSVTLSAIIESISASYFSGWYSYNITLMEV